ncbi:hypothetical protein R1flu_022582 [Riccia fluitans]|uniref:Uncharacterized protein n=1 Tax=Riccia fluitans TaxID=41844 RepID=A0ABD1XPN6_9MARC
MMYTANLLEGSWCKLKGSWCKSFSAPSELGLIHSIELQLVLLLWPFSSLDLLPHIRSVTMAAIPLGAPLNNREVNRLLPAGCDYISPLQIPTAAEIAQETDQIKAMTRVGEVLGFKAICQMYVVHGCRRTVLEGPSDSRKALNTSMAAAIVAAIPQNDPLNNLEMNRLLPVGCGHINSDQIPMAVDVADEGPSTASNPTHPKGIRH